ncbi:MAG: hypothetical protein ACK526_09415 [Planctomyces sp.]
MATTERVSVDQNSLLRHTVSAAVLFSLISSVPGCAGSRLRNFVTGNSTADYESLAVIEDDHRNAKSSDSVASAKDNDSQESEDPSEPAAKPKLTERLASFSPFRKEDKASEETSTAKDESSSEDAESTADADEKSSKRLFSLGKSRKSAKEDPFLTTVSAETSEEETQSEDEETDASETEKTAQKKSALGDIASKTASLEAELEDSGKDLSKDTQDVFAQLTGTDKSAEDATPKDTGSDFDEFLADGGPESDSSGPGSDSGESEGESADTDSIEKEFAKAESEDSSDFYSAMMKESGAAGALDVAKRKATAFEEEIESEESAATSAAAAFEELTTESKNPAADSEGELDFAETAEALVNDSAKQLKKQTQVAGKKTSGNSFDDLFSKASETASAVMDTADASAAAAGDSAEGGSDPFEAAARKMTKRVANDSGFNWKKASDTAKAVTDTAATADRMWGDAKKASNAISVPSPIANHSEGKAAQNSGNSPFYEDRSSKRSPDGLASHRQQAAKSSGDLSDSRAGLSIPPIHVASASSGSGSSVQGGDGDSGQADSSLSGDSFFSAAPASMTTQADEGDAAAPVMPASLTLAQRLRTLSVRTWLLILGSVVVAALLFAPGRRKGTTVSR